VWHSHFAGSRVWLLSQRLASEAVRSTQQRSIHTTLLASMTLEGMGPSLAVEGSTTAELFETYLEHVLLPELGEGRVVIMDSLPAHKPGRVRELIEEAFSKIKGILRRARARTREALLEALGEALSAVSLRDAWGFFEHAGYRTMGRLL
jgi:hypothetical protein